MPVFSYQSDLLTPQTASTGSLLTVVGTDSISIWAKGNDHKTLALKSWQFSVFDPLFNTLEPDIRAILGREDLLQMPFMDKTCLLSCATCTLIPRRLFSPENLEHYFKMLLRNSDKRVYGYEKLAEFDCFLVWASDPKLFHLCSQYFPGDNIRHLATPILRKLQQLSPEEGYAVFANLRGQKVQIAVFERQNLAFFNVFDFAKPADLLYFVLLAYKQFDLNPLETTLTLSGTLLEDSDIFRLLQRYVRPMRFPPLPSEFQLPEEAKNLPEHYWFDVAATM